jgi:DNA repair protein RadC
MIEQRDTVQHFDRSVLAALFESVSSQPHQAAIDVLEKFPSFQHATRAERADLEKIIGREATNLLLTIPNVVTSMTREVIANTSSYVVTLNAARAHFAALLNGRRNEAFAVIYLDTKYRYIEEDLWVGSVDRANVFLREIVRRAILVDASSVMIAHNHPSGDPRPSPEDILLTERLDTALNLMRIVLFDHLIFGEGEPYSLRANCDVLFPDF